MIIKYDEQQRKEMLCEYEETRHFNEKSLYDSHKLVGKREILEKLCPAMAAEDIKWAVSMSCGIYLRGIHDIFNDFDLLIDPKDVQKFEEVFEGLGGHINHNTEQKSAFTSPYYKEAEMDGVQFDLIGDITIETYGTVYRYSLEEIDWFTLRRDLNVPVVPVEAQYILYYMMQAWEERRKYKRRLCETYLCAAGVKYPVIFRRALEGTTLPNKYGKVKSWLLPRDLSNRIERLMELNER